MSLAIRFERDSSLLYITIVVSLLHLVCGYYAMMEGTPPLKIREKRQNLVVQTVRLQEKKIPEALPKVVAMPDSAPPKVVAKEVPAKVVAKEAPQKAKLMKTPIKKETRSVPQKKVENAAFAKARETLQKIEKAEVAVTTPIFESDYEDELVETLREHLKLPEYGNVDLSLKLSSKGAILHFKIEKSVSQLNRAYVESALPKLHFAPFNGSFAKKSDFLFHIVLTNDE